MARLETDRLLIRRLVLEDAPFILRLLNTPGFLEHIGDKGVRDLQQARAYLEDGPMKSWTEHGHGLSLVVLNATGEPLGLCGLLRRKPDQDVDLGYAFLPEFERQGYACEAAAGVLADARRVHGFPRILALVSPGNVRSIRLLEKLGFTRCPALDEEGTLYFEQVTRA
ncbi:MAG TPA: GNAT family N-acetyltransferase [Holophagaceae bacterium]|nr:GNAT family N-acetyltransferase [Holophagaceae bacterium]